jgi:hypothetical protein
MRMATSSDITMLREISAAGDRERTGALDVEWEGARATLFFMFGHPSHVVYEGTDGRSLDGEAALDAIVEELPTDFRVAPWRRAMVTDDTLHCSAEDLMGLFQRRHAVAEPNGDAAEPPAPEPATAPPPAPMTAPEPATTPEAEASVPDVATPPVPPAAPVPAHQPQPPFGLSDFPLLPLATALWTDAAANITGLEAAVPRLPDSLVVLSGPTSLGVAMIAGGRVTDAVWVNGGGGLLGDEAAQAVMTSLEGTLTAYRIDDPRLASALPMLWRSPRLASGLPAGWLHTDDVVAEVRTSGRSCVLLVDSEDRGVALFEAGELVGVYTAAHPWPATSITALRSLLHDPHARVSIVGDVAEPLTPVEPEVAAAGSIDLQAPALDEPSSAAVEPAQAESVAELEAQPVEPQESVQSTADTRKGRRNKRRRSDSSAAADDVLAVAVDAEDVTIADSEELAAVPLTPEADAAPETEAGAAPEPEAETGSAPEAHDEPVLEADAPAAPEASDEAPAASDSAPADDLRFEPAVFSIADLTSLSPPDPNGMAAVEAREAKEFVPTRLDIDVDALRAELTDIATVWLGEDDATPVAQAIGSARPGVDDFVSTIAAISTMEIPGHDTAVVRAMAREMHFRASEVLCGV